MDREYENLVAGFQRELESLASQHGKEREKAMRGIAAAESKKHRHLVQQQEQEIKSLAQQQKKDFSREKDGMKKVCYEESVLYVQMNFGGCKFADCGFLLNCRYIGFSKLLSNI